MTANHKFRLTKAQVKTHIDKLRSFMKKRGIGALYLSSFDPYLNEYVPLENCPRYYVTGFTGSTAEVLFPVEGKVRLYVDGRYHEQADLEVDLNEVHVVKCTMNKRNRDAILEDLESLAPTLVAYEGNRTPLNFARVLDKGYKTLSFDQEELREVVPFVSLPDPRPIFLVKKEFRGTETSVKLKRVFENTEGAYFLSALDDIAWITNCRGYHLPNQSSFMARALVVPEKVFVFIDENCPLDPSVKENSQVEFISGGVEVLSPKLKEIQGKHSPKQVNLDPGLINASDYKLLKNIFGEKLLAEVPGGLTPFKAFKDAAELKEIERSFAKSDQAIIKTIRWAREKVGKGEKLTELEYYHQANQFYKEVGAVTQSFNTIAAVGKNSSIIHFSSPSEDVEARPDDLMLLDSGGYYESGFATDTTRAFLAGGQKGKPSAKQIEIYTLVLKSMIQGHLAEVPEGTPGDQIDEICRRPIREKGYEYNHGTGHGVGIHVHEDGVRFSTASKIPTRPGQVVSVEPGIYIPGFGGVRLENVVVVERHPTKSGYIKFRSLVYVGFDPMLIDESMLTPEEMKFLEEYEAECKRRGTSLRN